MTRVPPRRVDVWGAAKVNIGWRVGAPRPDGFHEVCGLIHTTSLTDHLHISVDEQGSELVRVLVPGHPDLEDATNLVARAAEALAERAKAPSPTTIVVHKSIPVAAGLGGGSADAAAALIGLNTVWGAGYTARQLLAVGAQLGSDIPAILLGGFVHASGRGEIVRSIGAATAGWFVLGFGEESVAARAAYERIDDIRGLTTETTIGPLHHNDLEAAALSLVPELEGRLDAMRRAAGVAFVSGSGPSVVGVVADEAHARDVVARVRETFSEVVVARPSDWGVRLRVGGEGRN
jgi:4-diphosphocytidyl-2-C-methyl-D-erythritol kinase